MRSRTLFPLLAVFTLLPNALAQSPERALASHTVIQQTSDELLEAIDGRREMLEANPVELYAIVDAVLRTRFDTVYAARLILPRHWATITPEQRRTPCRSPPLFAISSHTYSEDCECLFESGDDLGDRP